MTERHITPASKPKPLERQSAKYALSYDDGSGERLSVSFDRAGVISDICIKQGDFDSVTVKDGDIDWVIAALTQIREDYRGAPKPANAVTYRTRGAKHDGRGPG